VEPADFDATRARVLTASSVEMPADASCVVYWMARDQRVEDNWALLYAKGVAESKRVPLKVVFNLVPKFSEATIRQYGFMIKGLQEVEKDLRALNIPMHLTMGDPVKNVPAFVRDHKAALLVVDFSPMRVQLGWMTAVAGLLDRPMVQVDAHNVVPCWVASPKLEYSARTIRSKITKLLPEYLVDIPAVAPNAAGGLDGYTKIDWAAATASLEVDRTVGEVAWLTPGRTGAWATIDSFCSSKLKDYADKRNDPNVDVASHLSPYYHFGQVSCSRVALHVKALKRFPVSTDSFLEESIIRRELADNYCFYNPRYDDLDSCYDWAKDTLRVHSSDPRPYTYSRQEFEQARTHDELWNAAQRQMVREGKMHGFLRMYWAKKILEWTSSPQEALAVAIWLNDKYELDGRDPNGAPPLPLSLAPLSLSLRSAIHSPSLFLSLPLLSSPLLRACRLRRLHVEYRRRSRPGLGRAGRLRQDSVHELRRLQAQVVRFSLSCPLFSPFLSRLSVADPPPSPLPFSRSNVAAFCAKYKE
jgi:deoxyribodipyrimidine photo-lyase